MASASWIDVSLFSHGEEEIEFYCVRRFSTPRSTACLIQHIIVAASFQVSDLLSWGINAA